MIVTGQKSIHTITHWDKKFRDSLHANLIHLYHTTTKMLKFKARNDEWWRVLHKSIAAGKVAVATKSGLDHWALQKHCNNTHLASKYK